MKNVRAGSSVSTLQVLEVLSDRISVDIFNAIAQKVTTSDSIIKLLGLTHKQYYTRHSYLLKTDLIKRRHSQLTLNMFMGKSLKYCLIFKIPLKISINRSFFSAIVE